MKTLLLILLVTLLPGCAFAADTNGTQQQKIITTSAFTRKAATNETYDGWRTNLSISTNYIPGTFLADVDGAGHTEWRTIGSASVGTNGGIIQGATTNCVGGGGTIVLTGATLSIVNQTYHSTDGVTWTNSVNDVQLYTGFKDDGHRQCNQGGIGSFAAGVIVSNYYCIDGIFPTNWVSGFEFGTAPTLSSYTPASNCQVTTNVLSLTFHDSQSGSNLHLIVSNGVVVVKP